MNAITKWHDVKQNGEEWDILRLGKITSSNLSLIMANYPKAFGESAKKYAIKLALERIRNCKSDNIYTNQHMERGLAQEPIARMLYENLYFTEVTNGGFFDCGYYGGSPDGLVGTDGVIEIKSVIDTVHYKNLKRGAIDPAYKWQIVGNLDCTSREWCDFISYCSDFPELSQIIVYRIYREDVKKELQILSERRELFNRLIQKIINEIPHYPSL
ncbi:lambda exonuclease family protein [Gilliamella sp. wkB308]|uniref:lambda exonuclease family protein n=1 Tax=Gilliamella sp. wkB308 TaxID=3120263 RepID=UPI00080E9BC3|nr:lambda exonuclease family protein [Gilliamella apicola]OCF98761.1 YqaJ-like viral recombinase [Gilliamella apicola]